MRFICLQLEVQGWFGRKKLTEDIHLDLIDILPLAWQVPISQQELHIELGLVPLVQWMWPGCCVFCISSMHNLSHIHMFICIHIYTYMWVMDTLSHKPMYWNYHSDVSCVFSRPDCGCLISPVSSTMPLLPEILNLFLFVSFVQVIDCTFSANNRR